MMMEDFTRRCLYPMTAPVHTKGYHVLLDYHKHYGWYCEDATRSVRISTTNLIIALYSYWKDPPFKHLINVS
jgi:hypothetical protein